MCTRYQKGKCKSEREIVTGVKCILHRQHEMWFTLRKTLVPPVCERITQSVAPVPSLVCDPQSGNYFYEAFGVEDNDCLPNTTYEKVAFPSKYVLEQKDLGLSKTGYNMLTASPGDQTLTGTVTFCKVIFDDEASLCFEQFGDTLMHAEKHAARKFKLYELRGKKIKFIVMYSPAAPCQHCCNEIFNFANSPFTNKLKLIEMNLGSPKCHCYTDCRNDINMLKICPLISLKIMNKHDHEILKNLIVGKK